MSKSRTAALAPRRSPVETLSRVPVLARALNHLLYTRGKPWEGAAPYDKYVSLAMAVRDLAVEQLVATQTVYVQRKPKRVYYLSLEFLLGRLLRDNLVNLGLYETVRDALAAVGGEFDDVFEMEPDAGLGNGGLGRLAACYLDSAATLNYPVYGYGIRYEHGIFEQRIENGWQVEYPEQWLLYGSPWEIVRPEFATVIRLRGRVEPRVDAAGRFRPTWVDCATVVGLPYDVPILGHRSGTVNILRLWSSRASNSFDMQAFKRGGFVEAVQEKMTSETISKVLYPPDETERGRQLRLEQQYFFVACTLADALRRFERENDDISDLPDKIAIQLNDTHPALAIAELMRLLVDDRGVAWDRAWEMTRTICAYTNHTLLPEALECWPVPLFETLLPRHLQIIYEINHRFLGEVERRWPGDASRRRRMSLIREDAPRAVRMAHLAVVGSHAVNGVAELHSRLLKTSVMPDFAALWPERFTNVTNGVTPRRWLRACNPGLADAITGRLGDGWVRDLDQLSRLVPLADDAAFQREFRQIKLANKQRVASALARAAGLEIDPAALFDVHVKRLHEYKRQLLNLVHVVMLYHEMIDSAGAARVPRVVLFGAKAAPSYYRAKHIIKLIDDVARTINRDARVNDRLHVAFLPNYRVSLAELVIPAADLSEQISTAGMEASGTGNMKFALNGALTIGTLDGANVEIRDAVGAEHFFLFGLTAEQVAAERGRFDPRGVYDSNAAVRRALDAIAEGEFNADEPSLHRPVRDWLLGRDDYFMLLADIESYVAAQRRVDALWREPARWARSAILNVAHVGRFSSDRAVREYAERIWNVERVLPDATPITHC
ncbi:MAG: glycogen/starch/alpha-glucan phosphorylase [Phycisphaerae bacterium]